MERRLPNQTLQGLNALIDEARRRLENNPDYISLQALEKARDQIRAAVHPKMVDDATGQELALVPTGRSFPTKGAPSQLEAADAVLRKAGEPLPTPIMVERVRSLGGTVGGKDPNINLGSTLSRNEKFVSVKWKGQPAWWFANVPLPFEFGKEAAE